MAVYKNNKDFYSCYSLKMMEELDRLGIEPMEHFVHLETKKHCQVYKMTEELSKFLTEWSIKKTQNL